MTSSVEEYEQADVVIITALQEEAEPFQRLMKLQGSVQSRRRNYSIGVVGESRVVISTAYAMGNASSAYAARDAITVWNPSLILLVGIAGGLADQGVSFGDILVPEQIVGFESAKVRDESVETRFEVYRPSYEVVQAARELANDKSWLIGVKPPSKDLPDRPQVFFGPAASGEKVIASKQWAEKYTKEWPKLIGVDMEGLGVALASYRAKERPSWGIIKSVSDLADAAKDDRYRNYAAANAAAFVVSLIARLKPHGAHPQPQRIDSTLTSDVSPVDRNEWGRRRVRLCRQLDDKMTLIELADFAGIRPHVRKQFDPDPRFWCREIWDYLESRQTLSELARILQEDMERPDLAKIVEGVLDK